MNRRKIEINNRLFEIWGSNPWHLITVPNNASPGYILVEASSFNQPDFHTNVMKYNALRRINPSGATLPVLFDGDRGHAMGREIEFIVNQKL